MRLNAKHLQKGTTTTTIKVEHDKPDRNISDEINALYALLGGYNQVARHVDLNEFKRIQETFNNAIEDLAYLM